MSEKKTKKDNKQIEKMFQDRLDGTKFYQTAGILSIIGLFLVYLFTRG